MHDSFLQTAQRHAQVLSPVPDPVRAGRDAPLFPIDRERLRSARLYAGPLHGLVATRVWASVTVQPMGDQATTTADSSREGGGGAADFNGVLPPEVIETWRRIFAENPSGLTRRRDKPFPHFLGIDLASMTVADREAFVCNVECVEYSTEIHYIDHNGDQKHENAFPAKVCVARL